MSLGDELRVHVRGEVDDSSEALDKYSRDASLFVIRPQAVVFPKDAADIESLVRLANERKDSGNPISLTPRAAGTDMSGGPLNDSVILDVTRHFNRTLEVGEGYATAEPGVYYRDFDKATQAKGWELPCYTASREINTVGGMVGNNSGGEKNLKFGKTARYVQALDVTLADGHTYTLEKLEGAALAAHRAKNNFEGRVYSQMCDLLEKNGAVIEAAKPKVEKNSSGYALWDIGDGRNSLDLARLMVGSQGTLGIISKIRFSLVRPQPFAAMTVLFVDDLVELGRLVPEVLAYKPDSFEAYDDSTFRLGTKYFLEFASQMKMGMLSLGLSFLPEVWMALTGGIPKLVLMAEFRSDTQQEALERAEHLAREVRERNPHVSVRVAKNERAARKYWTVRRESFNLLRKKLRGMRTAPFIDDFVVPPLMLPEFIPKLKEILSKYDLFYTVAGHVGDGNLHLIPLMDPKRPEDTRIIDELSHKVYDLVISYHGSITGEHNDGLVRAPYVEKMFGKDMYQLFLETKRIFDPDNIFNPHKKIGVSFSDMMKHLDLPHP